MKKSFAFLFVCFFICTASIKTNEFKRSENSSINAPSYFQEQELENINWVSLNLEIKNSPVEFFSKWKSLFKLSNEDNFKLIQQKTDDLGHNHYYYNQSFKGIPIELSSVILHEENGIEIGRAHV